MEDKDATTERRVKSLPEQLPESLRAIRDGAVEHALGGGPLPDDVGELASWVEEGGESVDLDEVAIDLSALAADCFSDEYARSRGDFLPGDQLTDDDRVKYARSAIEQETNYGIQFSFALTHVPIRRSDGAEAILGFDACLAGQDYSSLSFSGVYRSAEDYRERVRGSGMLVGPDIDGVTDETILGLWRRTEPR